MVRRYIFTLFLFVSCAGNKIQAQRPPEEVKTIAKVDNVSTSLSARAKKVKSKKYDYGQSYDVNSNKSHVGAKLPLRYKRRHFDFWVSYFTKREKERFKRHMRNASKYEHVVRAIFRQHGLPEDLFYVGLIESGYNTKTSSHANAVGPWQFISSTAKNYGLRIDQQIDERQNIVKATRAAARYLHDLYNIFANWELAICAYNKGEYGMIRAIRKANSREYLELVNRKLLPQETILYIPKIAAAREIYRNKSRYNMQIDRVPSFEQTVMARIHKSFSLSSLSQQLKISKSQIINLNHDIKTDFIRVHNKPVEILLPKSKAAHLQTVNISMGGRSKSTTPKARGLSSSTTIYVVQKGDTLWKIAKQFGTDINTLKELNEIEGAKTLPGQEIEVPI